MKKIILILFGYIVALSVYNQEIHVTFSAAGAASSIDSVKATNLKTRQSVSLPGNATLILATGTGILMVPDMAGSGIIYPNPFPGIATLTLNVSTLQTIQIMIHNLSGRLVANSQLSVQPGQHDFELSLEKAGVYAISIKNAQVNTSYKVICTEACGSGNRILYKGKSQNPGSFSFGNYLKVNQSAYSLGYSKGDVIHYMGMSGIYSVIITDTLPVSKNYVFEFAACTDPDGKNYSIVKIGNQTWMAENLAYLPAVYPSNEGSDTSKYYYVYGYQGRSISEAKQEANYMNYGVLYNWLSAMDGESGSASVPSGVKGICPKGWHLPSHGEWNLLRDYLILNGYGHVGNRMDIAKSMASTSLWVSWTKAGTPGNNPSSNNRSGFNAFPVGSRDYQKVFEYFGYDAFFWTSTGEGPNFSWSWWIYYRLSYLHWSYLNPRGNGYSVRCVKD